MMLEMLNPVTQQLNEMKLLYENTKACSGDTGVKIDELKKIIALQQSSLTGGQTGPNPFINGQANPHQMEQFLDPEIIKKGMREIKDQMLDVQKEAHIIESEMEVRFKDMLMKNEAKKRFLPDSLTSEMEGFEAPKDEDCQGKVKKYGFAKTRELVTERLGGPFDYNQFQEDIRKIKVEKDQLKRVFKQQALMRPDLTSEDFGGKKAYYDYSTRPILDNMAQMQAINLENETRMTTQKPDYLDGLVKEQPTFMLQNFVSEQQPA